MAPSTSALDSGNPDNEDGGLKADRLAARAARFSSKLPGNRYKELEELRSKERKVFEDQGLIKVGQTQLSDAVDMKGTCEKMCSDYEREFREYTREIHPFEAGPSRRMDPDRAVAAYSRSDAGAGHGDSAILPSDLRTPATLVRTLDYLFSVVLPTQPPDTPGPPTARKALGYSAGFIRDRTRAIRKEFAMQSSWGHEEAIASFERIARWHILCLRELQEETGMNSDMHIDSAELGRCFTSLRQHYNDRREELGIDMPCRNEPEFQAYMLIFSMTDKSVAIPISELPSSILDHPLVQLAWKTRRTAQRNFDSQKEGSKQNSELGANLINFFVRLLMQPNVPYLLSCMVEIRLREMRRSALRALTRTYPRLRGEPVRVNEQGEVVERRMVLIQTLDKILGCEEQETEESAYDDVDPLSRNSDAEAVDVVSRFSLQVFPDRFEPLGSLINVGANFNDNEDAPYTRRWRSVTDKRTSMSFGDIVNGHAGVQVDAAGVVPSVHTKQSLRPSFQPPTSVPAFSFGPPKTATPRQEIERKPTAFSFGPTTTKPAFTFGQSSASGTTIATPPIAPSSTPMFGLVGPAQPPTKPTFSFSPQPNRPPTPTTGVSAQPTSSSLPFSFTTPIAPASVPSTTTPAAATLPFSFTTPAPVQPVSVPPTPPSQPSIATRPTEAPSSTTPTVTPSAKALGKRPAHRVIDIPEPAPRPRGISSSTKRRLAPAVTARLIDDFSSTILGEMTGDLLKEVKREAAARQYALASLQRRRAIEQWSQGLLEMMCEEHTTTLLRRGVLRSLKRRFLARKTIKHWRQWVSDQKERAKDNKRKKEESFARFKEMGLPSIDKLTLWDRPEPSTSAFRDEYRADVALREAAAESAHFLASSSYLWTIANHVSDLFCERAIEPSLSALPTAASTETHALRNYKQFDLIFSSAEQSATPASLENQEWLVSKFLSRDADGFLFADVFFSAYFMGRFDVLPKKATYGGLVIYEAPKKSHNEEDEIGNMNDAQDRLGTLTEICRNQSNQYLPVMIILTWEEETLQEVIDRLEIQDYVDSFFRVAVMNMHKASTLDAQLDAAIKAVLPWLALKTQVVLWPRKLVHDLSPIWDRFLTVVRLMAERQPSDARSATMSFKLGIEIINALPKIGESAIGGVKKGEGETWKPVVLPPFEAKGLKTIEAVADCINEYLENETFSGLDELSLLATPLLYAARNGAPLPIAPILSALGIFAFGELSEQRLPLEVYHDASTVQAICDGYYSTTFQQFEKFVNKRINQMSKVEETMVLPQSPLMTDDSRDAFNGDRRNGQEVTTRTTRTPMGLRTGEENGSTMSATATPTRNGIKRGRASGESDTSISAKEGKAIKNARLLRAMEDVNATLEQMTVQGVIG